MILLGELQKMYSTNLTLPHIICSELTPPNITLLLSFVHFYNTFKKLYFWKK